ncbi:hypothetical protein PYW07_013341 [Mythimna separata]|uniref:Uncharacterized protein n=1 Tax=Mythimna separata TaxID=271217 RepID=A0AAD8DJH5_MYTSE|nr:hypothetical protein PYW07_013341 [Mythimna separata]
MYKKRDGTSGVEGQLYETKLISLIHFRAKSDDKIKDYSLASNFTDIGTFDDICIRAKLKIKKHYKPVAIFIQAKHITSLTEKLPMNSKNNLAKWFSSYLKIRSLFEIKNKDFLFRGNFEETNCLFIIYTNAKANLDTEEFKSDFSDKLNSWIGTGKKGLQLRDMDKEIAYLCEINLKEEFTALAVQLAKFLSDYAKDDGAIMPMHGDLILRYHVILAQNVLEVSEIKCENNKDEYRIASFQTAFFTNEDDNIKIFKDTLLNEMLRNRKLEEPELNSLISKLYINKQLDVTVLSSLIGNIVTFNATKFKLQFVIPVSDDLRRQLAKADVQQSQVNAAIELALTAAKDMLTQQEFKVPATFGNKDLIIKKNKTERRLDYLKTKVSDLITKTGADKIVTLDESLGDGLLKLNGGIAGIVGNILVSEENTGLLKFTDDWESLGDISKRLYIKLQSEIENLLEYKFDVKAKKIPKLSFLRDEHDENLASGFLNRLLFFTNQADERNVEMRLKEEILNQKCLKVDNIRVTADAVFLQYHDLIQKWWMLKEASYLTKQSTFFEEALELIVDKPLMTIISNTYNMINTKYITDYEFNEKALSFLEFQNQPPATIVVTENSVTTMTVAKMVQSLKKIDHFVFDLKYILDLQETVYDNFIKELKEINENELMLFDCNNVFAKNTYSSMYCMERLENIAKLIETKRTLLIIKKTFVETITNYFENSKNILTDERWSLIQMNEKTRRDITENAELIFQGVKMSLMLIMDDVTMGFVEEEVLNKILMKEPIVIGNPNSYSNYENFERIYKNEGRYVVSEEGVLKPQPYIKGLTFEKVLPCWTWKVKINLLEHNHKLLKWRAPAEISYTLTLEFFCEIFAEKPAFCPIYCNYSFDLDMSDDGVVTLKNFESDHWIVFELKMFLHFCNRKESTNMKMVFIFDCIDDIFSRDAKEVFDLLRTVKYYPCRPEIWISSRSKNVIFILQKAFNNQFEMHLFTCEDQYVFLLKYRSPA